MVQVERVISSHKALEEERYNEVWIVHACWEEICRRCLARLKIVSVVPWCAIIRMEFTKL